MKIKTNITIESLNEGNGTNLDKFLFKLHLTPASLLKVFDYVFDVLLHEKLERRWWAIPDSRFSTRFVLSLRQMLPFRFRARVMLLGVRVRR